MTIQGELNTNFRRGFGLIDVLLAVAASSLVYAGMAQFQNDQRLSASAVSTAHQLATVSDAAKSYIKKNYVKLNTLIPANSVKEIPLVGNPNWNGIGDVQYGGGLISMGFNPILPNGQEIHLITHHLSAVGNIPEHFESMLVTTGAPMSDRQVGVAMNAMEGNGGGMMKRPPTGIPGNIIQGSFGSWSQPISTWASAGVPLTYGHVIYAMDTIGSPISDYLNRYNTGDPEANRLHAHIDFNGNNADNMNNLDVQSINNTRADSIKINTAFDGNTNLRITNVGNSVSFKNGLNLCENNTVGCGISVSDDGGFYDYNDRWITLTNAFEATGLHLSGSNNGSGNLWADGYGKFQGVLGSAGFDPQDLPTLAAGGKWQGGLHTRDVLAAATIATSMDDSANNLSNIVNRRGFILGNHLDAWDENVGHTAAAMRSNGDIYASGKIGTGSYQPGQGDPQGWAGGLSTWDVTSHGTIAAGVDDNGVANVIVGSWSNGQHKGVVTASERIMGQVLHPTYIANQGDSCSGVAYGDFGNRNQYTLSNGDFATDSHGSMMSCVDGTWQYAGGQQFSRVYSSGCQQWGGSGSNNTNRTHIAIMQINADHKGASASIMVNGLQTAYIDSTDNQNRVSQTVTVVLPPYSHWEATNLNRVNAICVTEME